MLGATPDRDSERNRLVAVCRMVVRNPERADINEPISLPRVAPALGMSLEERVLELTPRDPEALGAYQRMSRPANDYRIVRRHLRNRAAAGGRLYFLSVSRRSTMAAKSACCSRARSRAWST